MSRIISNWVTCAMCGHEQEVRTWDSVNVTMDPEQKELIIQQRFFFMVCASCGKESTLLHSCLYHDMRQKLMIWLIPNLDAESQKNIDDHLLQLGMSEVLERDQYTLRAVSNPNELREKILIGDAGLDDRVVELMKPLYISHLAEQLGPEQLGGIYFDTVGECSVFALLLQDGRTATAPFSDDIYLKVDTAWGDAARQSTPQGYACIDGSWARGVLFTDNQA